MQDVRSLIQGMLYIHDLLLARCRRGCRNVCTPAAFTGPIRLCKVLVCHDFACTLGRLVYWRWDLGVVVCRRWRRILLHAVTLIVRLSVVRVASLRLGRATISILLSPYHPPMIGKRRQSLANASLSVVIATHEEQDEEAEKEGDDCVACS